MTDTVLENAPIQLSESSEHPEERYAPEDGNISGEMSGPECDVNEAPLRMKNLSGIVTQITTRVSEQMQATVGPQLCAITLGSMMKSVDARLGPILAEVERLRADLDYEKKSSFSARPISSKSAKLEEQLEEQMYELPPKLDCVECDAGRVRRQLSSPDLVDPAATVCKFYARGVCTRGASCRFAHISPQWSDEQPVVQQSPAREERQPDDSDDSFQDAMEQNEELALIGMTVRTLGLLNSPEYNDRFGVVLELLPSSGRYRVQFDPKTVRALKRANLQFPAICPQCEWEVTGSQCFNCGHGE